MSFSKHINSLLNRGDGDKFDSARKEMLTNKITVNFDIFCSFIEDIIMNNLNGTSQLPLPETTIMVTKYAVSIAHRETKNPLS